MKLFSALIGLLILAFGQPTTDSVKTTAPADPLVTASVQLADGTRYTETLPASEAKNFNLKMEKKFGKDAFCCCEYQFPDGSCRRRRNTCEESREAFCDCVAEETEDEISWCND